MGLGFRVLGCGLRVVGSRVEKLRVQVSCGALESGAEPRAVQAWNPRIDTPSPAIRTQSSVEANTQHP